MVDAGLSWLMLVRDGGSCCSFMVGVLAVT